MRCDVLLSAQGWARRSASSCVRRSSNLAGADVYCNNSHVPTCGLALIFHAAHHTSLLTPSSLSHSQGRAAGPSQSTASTNDRPTVPTRHHAPQGSALDSRTPLIPRPRTSDVASIPYHCDATTMSVTLKTTSGDIKLELFCQACPKTTYNFLALCASGAYDGSPFHRSIANFMVQSGSPASGSTKESNSIYGDMFEDEIKVSLRHHTRGILSMANKGPGTNGSQFYITYAPAPHLDGKNTVFGRVLEGWEILDAIEAIPVDKKSRPQQPVKIESVQIHANPLADEK
jgi:peptidyl-prolyl cis-trans isomerase-like 3